MPIFEYSGFNAAGKKLSGTVEASGRRAVLQKLRGQGIYPTTLQEESAAAAPAFARLRLARRVPSTELAAATRQLATLLGAGLPLDEALATIGSQLEHDQLARTFNAVREEIVQGESLHAALGRHPRIFPVLYVNMVQVGESSGTLDKVLQRLADFLEAQARMKSRIQAAMAYPLLMGVIGTGVLFFLFAFVVPKVVRMIQDLGQTLPLPTLMLIRTSDFFSAWWWLLLLLLLAAAGRRAPLCPHRGRPPAAGPAGAHHAALRPPQPAARHLPLHPHPGDPAAQRGASAEIAGDRLQPDAEPGAAAGPGGYGGRRPGRGGPGRSDPPLGSLSRRWWRRWRRSASAAASWKRCCSG